MDLQMPDLIIRYQYPASSTQHPESVFRNPATRNQHRASPLREIYAPLRPATAIVLILIHEVTRNPADFWPL